MIRHSWGLPAFAASALQTATFVPIARAIRYGGRDHALAVRHIIPIYGLYFAIFTTEPVTGQASTENG